MRKPSNVPSLAHWFAAHSLQDVTQITKQSSETCAWFASVSGRELFLKFYPEAFEESHAATEIAIAGANLHPAIIPLRQTIPCREGTLLVYDRVQGENLGTWRREDVFKLSRFPSASQQ